MCFSGAGGGGGGGGGGLRGVGEGHLSTANQIQEPGQEKNHVYCHVRYHPRPTPADRGQSQPSSLTLHMPCAKTLSGE